MEELGGQVNNKNSVENGRTEQVVLIRDIDLLSMVQAILTSIPMVSKLIGGKAGFASKLNSAMEWSYFKFRWVLPCTSINLSHGLYGEGLRNLFGTIYAATMFLTLGVLTLLTYLDNRFRTDYDACTINFLEDRTNIFLYATVVPCYVSICIILLITSANHWYGLVDIIDRTQIQDNKKVWRNVSSFFLVIFFCTIVSVLYIHDAFDPHRIKALSGTTCEYPSDKSGRFVYYWFLDNNGRANFAGYYYAFLNFILQMITVITGLCFISVNIDAVRYVNYWQKSLFTTLSPEIVAKHVKFLDTVYILAKILASVYLINIFAWKGSPLGCLDQSQTEPTDCTFNVGLSELFMITVGLILVNFPRQYVVNILEKYYKSDSFLDDKDQVRVLGIGDVINDRETYWANYPGGIKAAVLLLFIDGYLFSTFLDAFIFSDALKEVLYRIGVSN